MNYIDRGEAMNLLNEAQVEYDENYKGLGLAKKIISDMKPVEPETPKGEWVVELINNPKSILNGCVKAMFCSVCGKRFGFRTDFCPNCGADMRGGE